jgi:hypothetical protein
MVDPALYDISAPILAFMHQIRVVLGSYAWGRVSQTGRRAVDLMGEPFLAIMQRTSFHARILGLEQRGCTADDMDAYRHTPVR